MARKFLFAVALVVVLVIGALLGLRFWARELSQIAFVPASRFVAPAPLPLNAYANPGMWISAPLGSAPPPDDPARWLPAGAGRAGARQPVAVFFLHPTSHFDHHGWNAPLTDNMANSRADVLTRGLASPFGAAAEIWAPRYRQATFGAFLTNKPAGAKAIDAAYGDALAAFDYFAAHSPLVQDGHSPIVLVGHSQGALLLIRLLHDRVAGTALARRLVAAYAPGWPIGIAADLPLIGLPACDGPDATGCILSWQSFAEPADPGMLLEAYHQLPGLDGKRGRQGPFVCTNPLTGRPGSAAPARANLGTLVPDANLTGGSLVPGMVSARCDAQGLLLIGPPPQMGPFALPGNNYHLYDIPLFWANIRADFAARLAAWQRAQR